MLRFHIAYIESVRLNILLVSLYGIKRVLLSIGVAIVVNSVHSTAILFSCYEYMFCLIMRVM